MPRTAGSIPIGGNNIPPKGKYNCVVNATITGRSAQKKTPYVELLLTTDDGIDFSDQVYVTGKALNRLCLVARRVCGMPDDFEIPDDNDEAAKTVANYIVKNVPGKMCLVTVEENDEKYMPQSGPDAGRTITIKKRRVSFNGYDKPIITEPQPEIATPQGDMAGQQQEEELPF